MWEECLTVLWAKGCRRIHSQGKHHKSSEWQLVSPAYVKTKSIRKATTQCQTGVHYSLTLASRKLWFPNQLRPAGDSENVETEGKTWAIAGDSACFVLRERVAQETKNSRVLKVFCSWQENNAISWSWGQRRGHTRLHCAMADRQGSSRAGKVIAWSLAFWIPNSHGQVPFIADLTALQPLHLTLTPNIWIPQETITPLSSQP